jgi:hypothetical protein
VNERGCCDERIFQMMIVATVHELRPAASTASTLFVSATSSSHVSICEALSGCWARVISMPAWISPSVTAEIVSDSSGIFHTHLITPPCGLGLRNSEMTSVLRR